MSSNPVDHQLLKMYMGSHSHAPAVLLQVYEYRYNVEFSDTYASVSYTNHNFQTFSQADSCANCTLQDVFVGINRYHRFFFLVEPGCRDQIQQLPCGNEEVQWGAPAFIWEGRGDGESTFFRMREAITSDALSKCKHAGHTSLW